MKMTIELNPDEIVLAIKSYISHKHGLIADKIEFNVCDTSDDRFGGGPRYQLTSVSAEITK